MVYKLIKSEHTLYMALVCSRMSIIFKLYCKHVTLAINMLNKILHLYIETQNYYLKYLNVLH
jgi:uncharacterized protein YjaG (DUF416 family)